MKLSTERWDEWFTAPVTDEVSAESELSGIVACMNRRFSRDSVILTLPRLWVYSRFRRLWPRVSWRAECEMNEIVRVRSRGVLLLLPASLYRAISRRTRRDDFIRWSWARGVFGCTGNVYNPRRGYYCAMRFHSAEVFAGVLELLRGSGIACSYRENSGVRELSIRSLQHVTRFCYFIGLESVAQDLEKRSLLRSGRDLANRQANCDGANIRRSVASSRAQKAYVEFLCASHADLIPDELLPLARARLEHTESSLSELGDLLRPQVSKSTVKYRLDRLKALAESVGFRAEE